GGLGSEHVDRGEATERLVGTRRFPMLPLVEEPAAAMGPTRDFGDQTRRSPLRTIQGLEPGIAIGLQEPGECSHVRSRMLATAIGTVEVCGSRRCSAAERPVVAH